MLDQEEEWLVKQLDTQRVSPKPDSTVIHAFKDRCLKECFRNRNWQGDPGNERMEWVHKTLVFAKDDDHCDRIVDAVREVFDEGNAFATSVIVKSVAQVRCAE